MKNATNNDTLQKLNDEFNRENNFSLKSLYELAKKKSEFLNVNQSLRLTDHEKSYTIMNLGGIVYIGSFKENPMPKMFKKKSVMSMTNGSGKEVGDFQRLI